jgi:hypothetical protein
VNKEKVGREPIEIIEIDQDFCALEYGTTNSEGTCNADLSIDKNKCFNTLGTCGSVADYLEGGLTLRFCNNQKNQPDDFLYFPFLQNAKIKPAVINPGSADKSITALGKRATINASFSDHPSTDRYVDNYLAERRTGAAQFDGVGYEPLERSTFWRKWRARNLYYLFRPMRYISGYVNEDGDIVDSITQHFVITKVTGPDNGGKVSIEGKDILTLAQTDKAEAPRASSGKLSAGIDAIVTSLTLTPSGIGALEYSAAGYVRIGEEVCGFTRAADVLTIARGVYNTSADAHSAGDTVQECLEYNAQLPYQILYDLLNNFSNISSDYLDQAQWIEESVTNNYLPLAYTTIITEPTPVQKLIAEMTQQMYFYTWFDTRTSLVKIRAVRPIGEDDIIELNYSANIIADSIKVSDKPDQIISRVVVNYAMFNPAKDLEEASNYRVSDVYVNLDLEGVNKNRSSSTKTIYSRWLTSAAGAAAQQLAEKLIARYQVPPEEVTFSLDAKDRDIWTGDFCQITSPYNVNSVGEEEAIDVQILSGEESIQGTTFSYIAQRFRFEEAPIVNERLLRISADQANLDLRAWYDTQYPATPPLSGDVIIFEIDENVIIYSTSTATPAIVSGTWPAGVELSLIIKVGAYVVGKGGTGGTGSYGAGGAGGAGGPGLAFTAPISINNFGLIGGGGGGGGAGGGEENFGPSVYDASGGGGGGGGGYGVAGITGPNTVTPTILVEILVNPTAPAAGTVIYGGIFGLGMWFRVIASFGWDYYNSGNGGNGGTLGAYGSAGAYSRKKQLNDPAYINLHPGGAGGAPGAAVTGGANVTWLQYGIVYGSVVP